MIERIAAGEVIERPASVVRELLDNALDAGATSIRVEIQQGGLRLVRVADDGCGIPPEQLPLACQPHTTSKVHSLADLDRIATLGFRGEALASIAAVSELELSSAAADDGVATVLRLAPGGAREHGATARTRGTTATVRGLFQTVPARAALLRGPRAEAARVHNVVRSYALAHPTVRFVLVSEHQLVLQTPGSGLRAAVAALYGTDLERALQEFGPLHAPAGEITGAIAARSFTHAGREHIVVAVNGRPVANRGLLASLETGYRPLLRKGRHPVLIVRIALAADRVDANVHPAKATVLLAEEAQLGAILREAVHHALGSAPSSVALFSTNAHLRPTTVQLRLPLPRKRRGLLLGTGRAPTRISPALDAPEVPETPLPELVALGQLDHALILARSPADDLYLVDQHRAHERALYEQLRQQPAPTAGTLSESGHAMRSPGQTQHPGQLLLEPVLVELSPRQAELLSSRTHELAALGLDLQPFGGAVFLIRALPGIAARADSPAELARVLASDAAEDAGDWLDHVCISLACRTATRRGQRLSPREQQQILDALRTVSAPAVCPHGSPLLLRFSRGYLRRAFEW
jgi:DNA mismatch repair protein MutL